MNRMAMNKVIKNDIVCVLDCSELVPLGFVLVTIFLFPGCPVPLSKMLKSWNFHELPLILVFC